MTTAIAITRGAISARGFLGPRFRPGFLAARTSRAARVVTRIVPAGAIAARLLAPGLIPSHFVAPSLGGTRLIPSHFIAPSLGSTHLVASHFVTASLGRTHVFASRLITASLGRTRLIPSHFIAPPLGRTHLVASRLVARGVLAARIHPLHAVPAGLIGPGIIRTPAAIDPGPASPATPESLPSRLLAGPPGRRFRTKRGLRSLGAILGGLSRRWFVPRDSSLVRSKRPVVPSDRPLLSSKRTLVMRGSGGLTRGGLGVSSAGVFPFRLTLVAPASSPATRRATVCGSRPLLGRRTVFRVPVPMLVGHHS